MRILIASPELPYPPAWGFSIRVFQLLTLLARRHDVALLSYVQPGDDAKVEALQKICGAVHSVPAPAAKSLGKRLAQLKSVASRRSFQGSYLYSDAMQRKLDELCSGTGYDIIQLETSQMMTFAFDPRSAVVIAEHDVVYELLGRIAASERSSLRRVYNAGEARKYRREEIERWRTAAACIVTSTRELPIVRAAGVESPVLVAPNCVDVDYFAPVDKPVDPNALVMTGLMRTRPNIDAAVHFVKDILPLIVARRPGVKVYIVGADPPDEVQRLAGPSVIVTGGVPDVRPYVGTAAVVVVPLRMGGGTRLKVLEGLAMRRPMVSTSLGCEGIDVVHDQHLLVADGADAFATAVVRILESPAVGSGLAERGHALVHERYRWATTVGLVEAFYEELIRNRRAQPR